MMLASILVGILAGCAAIVLGRRLTRSVAAAATAFAALVSAFAVAGVGFLGWMPLVLWLASLGLVQLFGWMLVDAERDHLPPTDGLTRLARGIAFALLGGGLLLLARSVTTDAAAPSEAVAAGVDPVRWGRALFMDAPDLALLCGLVVAAAFLATMTTLRDDGEVR